MACICPSSCPEPPKVVESPKRQRFDQPSGCRPCCLTLGRDRRRSAAGVLEGRDSHATVQHLHTRAVLHPALPLLDFNHYTGCCWRLWWPAIVHPPRGSLQVEALHQCGRHRPGEALAHRREPSPRSACRRPCDGPLSERVRNPGHGAYPLATSVISRSRGDAVRGRPVLRDTTV